MSLSPSRLSPVEPEPEDPEPLESDPDPDEPELSESEPDEPEPARIRRAARIVGRSSVFALVADVRCPQSRRRPPCSRLGRLELAGAIVVADVAAEPAGAGTARPLARPPTASGGPAAPGSLSARVVRSLSSRRLSARSPHADRGGADAATTATPSLSRSTAAGDRTREPAVRRRRRPGRRRIARQLAEAAHQRQRQEQAGALANGAAGTVDQPPHGAGRRSQGRRDLVVRATLERAAHQRLALRRAARRRRPGRGRAGRARARPRAAVRTPSMPLVEPGSCTRVSRRAFSALLRTIV